MIHLAEPWLCGNEEKYVNDALRRGQLSAGSYVENFEASFASLMGCAYGISTTSGTTSLHLILAAMGIGHGDEVIVPALTFVATANAVRYVDAIPVLADVNSKTWCIDPVDVDRKITPYTACVIAVHLYGHPADMTELRGVCGSIPIIEDAAEAPGARWGGLPVGSLGTAAAFSFYGNKIITTGEGGMVTTNDETLARVMRKMRGQGQDPERRYWHPTVGFNYRMTEMQGALGLAQVENLELHLNARQQIANAYHSCAPELDWQGRVTTAKPVYWMNVALFRDRDEVAKRCLDEAIETRPTFYPLHAMPPYRDCGAMGDFPVAERVAAHGLCLPSHACMTLDDVADVCEVLHDAA